MSNLRQSLADYLAVRRALGFPLKRTEKLLVQFIAFLEDRGNTGITTEMAVAWATLPQAGSAWSYARLSVVRRFAIHMRSIDPATEIPPTHILTQRKQRATPFLYAADATGGRRQCSERAGRFGPWSPRPTFAQAASRPPPPRRP